MVLHTTSQAGIRDILVGSNFRPRLRGFLRGTRPTSVVIELVVKAAKMPGTV